MKYTLQLQTDDNNNIIITMVLQKKTWNQELRILETSYIVYIQSYVYIFICTMLYHTLAFQVGVLFRCQHDKSFQC